ncbi:hypothetical protein C1646_749000 [Rhizophagus diaphanus]|nr:hypothetical protein C1646_749000 [Rhizophagus diaphanus] [Rhizophagus sp. MUCL 43196]
MELGEKISIAGLALIILQYKYKSFLTKKDLQIKNIDGATEQLKKENPFMTSVHSIAHRLHLAGQVVVKEVLMQDINDTQLTILNIINTRWLSTSNVAHNLHQVIFSVIDALNDDAINAENPKDRIRATRLINTLDPEFTISTMLLADLMYTFYQR